jgi:ubiquinone/menaquinone biosynthesis C-methylase UbiE
VKGTSPQIALAVVLALAVPSWTAAQGAPGQQGQAGAGHQTLFDPDELVVLESPDRDIWQRPDQVMDALGIADGSKVADIGAGAGYFTVRIARRVGPNGVVWAEDVQPVMIEAIKRRLARDFSKDIRNVRTQQGTSNDPMLPSGCFDAALILETYQEIPNRVLFLQNVRKALRPGGLVGIIDYKKSGGGPGPDTARPDPETIVAVAERAGLRLVKRETFLPFQFFLVFAR